MIDASWPHLDGRIVRAHHQSSVIAVAAREVMPVLGEASGGIRRHQEALGGIWRRHLDGRGISSRIQIQCPSRIQCSFGEVAEQAAESFRSTLVATCKYNLTSSLRDRKNPSAGFSHLGSV